MLDVDPIPALDALPAIATPSGALGPRPIESSLPLDPLLLADARSFRIDLGHGPSLAADEPALEQGKRRG